MASLSTTTLWVLDDLKLVFDQTTTEVMTIPESGAYSLGNTVFGVRKKGKPEHRFTYNGKERQEEFGLNWHDYGARFYDAQLSRFTTQDRFAEKYYDLSPYQYTAGNPIRFIDVNGDSVWVSINHKEHTATLHITGKVIDMSDRNVNLDKAVKDINKAMSSVYSGEFEIDGQTYTMSVDSRLEKAKSIQDIEDSDHLVVMASFVKNNKKARGVANQIGGKIAYISAADYTEKGSTYEYFGFTNNTRTAVHELGHLLGLRHSDEWWNLMVSGGSYTNVTNEQREKIYDNTRFSTLNRGQNSVNYGGYRQIPESILNPLTGRWHHMTEAGLRLNASKKIK